MSTITIVEKELQIKFEKALKSNKPAKVKFADHEGFFISKEEYESLRETSSIKAVPGLWEKIERGINAPREEFVNKNDLRNLIQ
ncbi:MAG: hypothetical protein FWB72_04490 [Firmicutes bacterium]|nr:hypothetical protein [Bacillota bacterium]